MYWDTGMFHDPVENNCRRRPGVRNHRYIRMLRDERRTHDEGTTGSWIIPLGHVDSYVDYGTLGHPSKMLSQPSGDS